MAATQTQGDLAGGLAGQPALLDRAGDLVDEVAGQVGGDQAEGGDQGGGAQADGHLPAVGAQVAEQAQDDGGVAARHQGLRLADGARHRVGVAVVGVGGGARPRWARQLALEHGADDLDRAALAVGVAQDGQRRFAGGALQVQQVAAQAGGLAHARGCARAR